MSRKSDDSFQIIGSSAIAGLLSFAFDHSAGCGRQDVVRLQQRPDGGYLEVSNGSEVPLIYELASPWAVDASGRELPTWFEAEGQTLRQVVDATGATAPILFDPTYSTVSCSGHYSNGNAAFYLNTSMEDPPDCPILGMLRATRRYVPVWGYEANVANEYGKLMVRQDGECSYLSDTGPSWDFQVPCKAHDYCYDLRRASFSGTVSDADCDDWMFAFMVAHCNDRAFVLASDCRKVADFAWLAVRAPWVVARPEPGLVTFRNLASAKCADVEGASQTQGAKVQQWTCGAVNHQRFRIWPAEDPPYFYIRVEHSDQCVGVRISDSFVTQEECLPWTQLQMRIQGARGQDLYSIRPRSQLGNCWHIPSSLNNGVKLDHPTCDEASNWFVWRITDVGS